MNPSFPTAVIAEPGIVDRYARGTCPVMYDRTDTVTGEPYRFMRTDLRGIMVSTALHPYVNYSNSSGRGAGASWHGCASWADAFTLAERGWLEVVPAITAQMERLSAKHTRSIIPVTEYADEPGIPDVSAYLEGEDEYFQITTEGRHDTPAVGNAVKIVMEPLVSAGIGTNELVKRGALIGAVIHVLESSGVRVALEFRSLPEIGYNRAPQVQVEVTLKAYGEPFDVRGLAFWLAHPAASRMFMFSALCQGHVGDVGSIGWSHRKPALEPSTIEISRFTTFENDGQLDKWAETVFKQAGISTQGSK